MSTWTNEELERLSVAEELNVAGLRADDTLRPLVTIWSVRIGDDIFVRSFKGPDAAWFRGTQVRGKGHIKAGGVSRDVVFTRDDSKNTAISDAYREKYTSASRDHIAAITGPVATSTTLRINPS